MDRKQAIDAVATRIFKRLKDFPSAEMVFVSDEYRILIPNMNVKIRISSRSFKDSLMVCVFTSTTGKNVPDWNHNLGQWRIHVEYTKKFSFRKIGARLGNVIFKRIITNVKRSYHNLYVMEDSADLLRSLYKHSGP